MRTDPFLCPGCEGIKFPEYKANLNEVETQFATFLKEAAVEEAESRQAIADLEKKAAGLQAEIEGLKTMTIDDVFAKDPALKAKIDKEVRTYIISLVHVAFSESSFLATGTIVY